MGGDKCMKGRDHLRDLAIYWQLLAIMNAVMRPQVAYNEEIFSTI
jgi:hypothetical protein